MNTVNFLTHLEQCCKFENRTGVLKTVKYAKSVYLSEISFVYLYIS